MSWSKAVTLWCDGDTEHCIEHSGNLNTPRVSQARSDEFTPGWTYVDGEDLCPECPPGVETERDY